MSGAKLVQPCNGPPPDLAERAIDPAVQMPLGLMLPEPIVVPAPTAKANGALASTDAPSLDSEFARSRRIEVLEGELRLSLGDERLEALKKTASAPGVNPEKVAEALRSTLQEGDLERLIRRDPALLSRTAEYCALSGGGIEPKALEGALGPILKVSASANAQNVTALSESAWNAPSEGGKPPDELHYARRVSALQRCQNMSNEERRALPEPVVPPEFDPQELRRAGLSPEEFRQASQLHARAAPVVAEILRLSKEYGPILPQKDLPAGDPWLAKLEDSAQLDYLSRVQPLYERLRELDRNSPASLDLSRIHNIAERTAAAQKAYAFLEENWERVGREEFKTRGIDNVLSAEEVDTFLATKKSKPLIDQIMQHELDWAARLGEAAAKSPEERTAAAAQKAMGDRKVLEPARQRLAQVAKEHPGTIDPEAFQKNVEQLATKAERAVEVNAWLAARTSESWDTISEAAGQRGYTDTVSLDEMRKRAGSARLQAEFANLAKDAVDLGRAVGGQRGLAPLPTLDDVQSGKLQGVTEAARGAFERNSSERYARINATIAEFGLDIKPEQIREQQTKALRQGVIEGFLGTQLHRSWEEVRVELERAGADAVMPEAAQRRYFGGKLMEPELKQLYMAQATAAYYNEPAIQQNEEATRLSDDAVRDTGVRFRRLFELNEKFGVMSDNQIREVAERGREAGYDRYQAVKAEAARHEAEKGWWRKAGETALSALSGTAEAAFDLTAGNAAQLVGGVVGVFDGRGFGQGATDYGAATINAARYVTNAYGPGSVLGADHELAGMGTLQMAMAVNPLAQAGRVLQPVLEGADSLYDSYCMKVTGVESRAELERLRQTDGALRWGKRAFQVSEVCFAAALTGGAAGGTARAQAVAMSRALGVAVGFSATTAVAQESYQYFAPEEAGGPARGFSVGRIAENTLGGTAQSMLFIGGMSKMSLGYARLRFGAEIPADLTQLSKADLSRLQRAFSEAEQLTKSVDFTEGMTDFGDTLQMVAQSKNLAQALASITQLGVSASDTADLSLAGVMGPLRSKQSAAARAADIRAADITPDVRLEGDSRQFELNLEAARPAVLEPFFSKHDAGWYQTAVRLAPDQIDPLYVELAKKNGEPLVLGGGSDLVQLVAGLPKAAGEAAELNYIEHPAVYADDPSKVYSHRPEVTLEIPAWKGRPAVTSTVSQNAESSLDLQKLVANDEAGRYLYSDHLSSMHVPIKHAAIAVISPDGTASLYFRTPQDFADYHNKVLTLPDAGRITPKEWLEATSAQPNNRFALESVVYTATVYARAMSDGWTLSGDSQMFLQQYLDPGLPQEERVTAESRNYIAERVRENLAKPGSSEGLRYVDTVLREIGVITPQHYQPSGETPHARTASDERAPGAVIPAAPAGKWLQGSRAVLGQSPEIAQALESAPGPLSYKNAQALDASLRRFEAGLSEAISAIPAGVQSRTVFIETTPTGAIIPVSLSRVLAQAQAGSHMAEELHVNALHETSNGRRVVLPDGLFSDEQTAAENTERILLSSSTKALESLGDLSPHERRAVACALGQAVLVQAGLRDAYYQLYGDETSQRAAAAATASERDTFISALNRVLEEMNPERFSVLRPSGDGLSIPGARALQQMPLAELRALTDRRDAELSDLIAENIDLLEEEGPIGFSGRKQKDLATTLANHSSPKTYSAPEGMVWVTTVPQLPADPEVAKTRLLAASKAAFKYATAWDSNSEEHGDTNVGGVLLVRLERKPWFENLNHEIRGKDPQHAAKSLAELSNENWGSAFIGASSADLSPIADAVRESRKIKGENLVASPMPENVAAYNDAHGREPLLERLGSQQVLFDLVGELRRSRAEALEAMPAVGIHATHANAFDQFLKGSIPGAYDAENSGLGGITAIKIPERGSHTGHIGSSQHIIEEVEFNGVKGTIKVLPPMTTPVEGPEGRPQVKDRIGVTFVSPALFKEIVYEAHRLAYEEAGVKPAEAERLAIAQKKTVVEFVPDGTSRRVNEFLANYQIDPWTAVVAEPSANSGRIGRLRTGAAIRHAYQHITSGISQRDAGSEQRHDPSEHRALDAERRYLAENLTRVAQEFSGELPPQKQWAYLQAEEAGATLAHIGPAGVMAANEKMHRLGLLSNSEIKEARDDYARSEKSVVYEPGQLADKINAQLNPIQAQEIDTVLRSFPDPVVATEILIRLTRWSMPESDRDTARMPNGTYSKQRKPRDGAISMITSMHEMSADRKSRLTLYTPREATLSDSLAYLANRKDAAGHTVDTVTDLAKAAGQEVFVVVDEVILKKLQTDLSFRQAAAGRNVRLVVPQGYSEGITWSNLPETDRMDAIREKIQAIYSQLPQDTPRAALRDRLAAIFDTGTAGDSTARELYKLRLDHRMILPPTHLKPMHFDNAGAPVMTDPPTKGLFEQGEDQYLRSRTVAIARRLNGTLGFPENRRDSHIDVLLESIDRLGIPPEHRGLVLRGLAETTQVVTHRQFTEMLINLESQISRIEGAGGVRFTPENICYVYPAPDANPKTAERGGSFIHTTRAYREANGAAVERSRFLNSAQVEEDIKNGRIDPGKTLLVMLDDFAGTGGSLRKEYELLRQAAGPEAHILLAPAVRTSDLLLGSSSLAPVFSSGSNVYDPRAALVSAEVHPTLRETKFFKSLSRGEQELYLTMIRHPGYGELATTIAFPHTGVNTNHLAFTEAVFRSGNPHAQAIRDPYRVPEGGAAVPNSLSNRSKEASIEANRESPPDSRGIR